VLNTRGMERVGMGGKLLQKLLNGWVTLAVKALQIIDFLLC